MDLSAAAQLARTLMDGHGLTSWGFGFDRKDARAESRVLQQQFPPTHNKASRHTEHDGRSYGPSHPIHAATDRPLRRIDERPAGAAIGTTRGAPPD